MTRAHCLFCNGTNLDKIIDLGIQPLADTFITLDMVDERDARYPLQCTQCRDCKGVQTTYVVSPGERYCAADYSYTSSNSRLSREYWDAYAAEAMELYDISEGDLVIEIGSNDGYLLEQFKNAGARVLGIDPSMYVNDLANKRGVRTITALFDDTVAEYVLSTYGRPKLVIANNVFNHSNEPKEFMDGISHLIDENSTFVCESPYWLNCIKSGRFDQIYHEHVFYFTAKTMEFLSSYCGLVISQIGETYYHGGSLRCTMRACGKVIPKVQEMIAEEERFGLYELKTYRNFMRHLYEQKDDFREQVRAIKEAGGSILAVGAAAKGNTLLTFYELDRSIIDLVTDASPHKQGKMTPLTRIPITADSAFAEYDEPYAIILSWNISDVLKEILHKINPKIKFLDLPE